jgi:hypothetical protein
MFVLSMSLISKASAPDSRDLPVISALVSIRQIQVPMGNGFATTTVFKTVKPYRFCTLLQTIVGVPFTLNIGPRTETVSPIPIAATLDTFSNMVCPEVMTVMDENPADPIIPGRL